MSMTWDGAPPPAPPKIGPGALIRIAWRGVAIVLTILAGLALFLPLRIVERPLFGLHRPWTPWITQGVCRLSLIWMGIGLRRVGQVMPCRGAIVANHSSWLDIFVLNAADRVCFVSKSEVSGWPGIGFLARVTGTLFIARDPRAAKAQTVQFEERLLAGQRLLFFPEGTSTDGLRVLPFKSTLFAAFFAPGLREALSIQPVTVVYHPPPGADVRFYGWWGDMTFGAHLVAMLAAPRHGNVEVIHADPIAVRATPDRKTLALTAQREVQGTHELRRSGAGTQEPTERA